MMNSLIRKPSAWIPIVIPLLFFVYIVIAITNFGVVHEEDEGIGAHLFQLWLVIEPFIIGFFAVKWWSQNPRQTLLILALQVIAALLPISVVFYFKL